MNPVICQTWITDLEPVVQAVFFGVRRARIHWKALMKVVHWKLS